MTTVSDRRILCLWLPRLPTDRRARDRRWSSPFHAPPERGQGRALPRVTVAQVGSARLLAAVDPAAEAAGLEPGLGLAEARALAPELLVEPHDPEADAAFLDALATACDRYTPLVALTPPDGLLLDIAGCAHLFGGEPSLLRDLRERVVRAGLSARAAIAPTAGAAWAMAHYGSTDILTEDGVAGALAPLPVEALRIVPEMARTLKRLGLKTIADLRMQPRAPLAARFGPELLRRLDQALGQEDEPITPRRPLPLLLVERRLAEPIFQWDVASAYLARLAGALEERLEARGEGARKLVLGLFHADGSVSEIAAATTGPVRDPGRITAVFAPKLEGLAARCTIDSGIDLIRLAAHETAPTSARQGDLDGHLQAEADLARLIDILSARLGADAVTRLVAGDSHIPEFAATAMPAQRVGARFDGTSALHQRATARRPYSAAPAQPRAKRVGVSEKNPLHQPEEPPERPLRLFSRPEPVEAVASVPDGPPASFRWRKVRYQVARSEGPERIAAEWWHGGTVGPTRDYFRVEDTDGRRFWLFREGLYERETAQPRWYLHGLFA
ncbi:DNA polymerase Y family protein [Amorphus sp. 3PC139-8]|uniref:Y-family DNA polymerase n=1 Tax=Amorphus sp. 3PC139-8 TaxID=2735676 RepID=UPI00345CBC53